MKCPYPDCPGEVQPGEQFCGECGRSLEPAAVQSALAGMQARTAAPVNTMPPPPTVDTQFRPPVMPVQMPPQQRPAPGPPIALFVGLGIGLLLLLALGVGGLAVIGSLTAGTPTPAIDPNTVQQTFNFQLADLDASNNWEKAYDIETVDGRQIGEISVRRGGTYEQQGAGEKMVSIIVAENGSDLVELAATRESTYEGIAPGWAVVEDGQNVIRQLSSGLTLEIMPLMIAVDRAPLLPNNRPGNQPIFSSLALELNLSGVANQ